MVYWVFLSIKYMPSIVCSFLLSWNVNEQLLSLQAFFYTWMSIWINLNSIRLSIHCRVYEWIKEPVTVKYVCLIKLSGILQGSVCFGSSWFVLAMDCINNGFFIAIQCVNNMCTQWTDLAIECVHNGMTLQLNVYTMDWYFSRMCTQWTDLFIECVHKGMALQTNVYNRLTLQLNVCTIEWPCSWMCAKWIDPSIEYVQNGLTLQLNVCTIE